MAKKKSNNVGITERTEFWLILVIALILILVGFVIYLVQVATDENYFNYEGKGGEYKIWRSKVGEVIFYHISVFSDNREYIYSFRNHPEDLEDIYLEENLDQKLNRPLGIRTLYVTRDPELYNMTGGRSVLAAVAFEQILSDSDVSLYKLNVSNTFTSSFGNSTVTSCSNVTGDTAVIYLKIGDEDKVYSENECIIIQGRGSEGLIRSSEKFAYYLLGVF